MKRSRSTAPEERRIRRFNLAPALALLVFGLLWQLLVPAFGVKEFILPTPSAVAAAFVKDFPLLMKHAASTTTTTLVGLALSIALGVGFALLMALSRPVRDVLYPFFVVLQTIPLIVLAPLLSIWMGFGVAPKIVVVVLVCFFPIAVGFADGLINSDPELDELLRVMGAGKWQTFRLARIPQGLPGLFSGLKITATYSVMAAVLSEWVGAKNGLGIFMTRAMSNFRTAALFADVALVVAMSLLLFRAAELLERRMLRHLGSQSGRV